MARERAQAEKTSAIMARESASRGSPVTDRTHAVGTRYVVTAWNHDEDSEKRESNALRAGRAGVFGEDDYLWGSGDIELEIPSEKGFMDIMQWLLSDLNPVSKAVPDKVLVASGTSLSTVLGSTCTHA